MKVSEHFYIQEFVPEEIYSKYGDKSIWFVSNQTIDLVEFIRNWFELPIFINTWHMKKPLLQNDGSPFQYSGFRPPDCKVGSKLSQHRFGRAADIKMLDVDYEQIRNEIRASYAHFQEWGLTTIEKDTPTWLHIDCRPSKLDDLYEVPYK